MKNLANCFLSLLLLLPLATLNSQNLLDHVPGEILVQFQPGVHAQEWFAATPKARSSRAALAAPQLVSAPMGIWKMAFDPSVTAERDLLHELQRDPAIAAAQLNYYVELRSVLPNDPRFLQQWHLLNTGQSGGVPGLDLNMDQAWNITTGGLSPAGDTIVLCIIDDGIDTLHEDLRSNLWFNRREIPNNRIDDDGNGYIDDYRGWHVRRNNDNVSEDNRHGTAVAGMAGAVGNNGRGVSGVNWKVKLMIIVGGINSTTEQIIQAYTYPLLQRKRYNATGGKEGAFVVATNSSWGIDRQRAENNPIWCAFYDTLGQAGIINIGAGPDRDYDVDVEGDMPSNCPSDFLIAATSIDASGAKARLAGFGKKSIDLASFGERVVTTGINSSYVTESGTSFAAPLVAGAAALLYAAPCPTLAVFARNDPPRAARLVRQALLAGVTPAANLANITAAGGYLDVAKSLSWLLDNCGDCPPLVRVGATNISTTRVELSWTANDSIRRVDLRWRPKGSATWITTENARAPFALTGLSTCTEYEFQLRALCRNQTLDYGEVYPFRTDGCCEPPQTVELAFVGANTALIRWNAVTAAAGYTFRYRSLGESTWITQTASFSSINLRNLRNCTTYEAQLRSECSGNAGPSAWGNVFTFKTFLCGACLDNNYCSPGMSVDQADEEWIEKITINGSFAHRSGRNGYGDFTGLTPPVLQRRGTPQVLRISSGFKGTIFTDYYTVWLDWNQDGQFGTNEIVAESGPRKDTFYQAEFLIPLNAKSGPTRLRLTMLSRDLGTACGISGNTFGEVEDYCVFVDTNTGTEEANPSAAGPVISLSPNPAQTETWLRLSGLPPSVPNLKLRCFNAQGQLQWSSTALPMGTILPPTRIPLQNWPPGIYLLLVESEAGIRITEKIVKW